MKFKNCPSCYHENSEDDLRCLRCGESLDKSNNSGITKGVKKKVKVCHKCGKINTKDSLTEEQQNKTEVSTNENKGNNV